MCGCDKHSIVVFVVVVFVVVVVTCVSLSPPPSSSLSAELSADGVTKQLTPILLSSTGRPPPLVHHTFILSSFGHFAGRQYSRYIVHLSSGNDPVTS